MKTVIRAGGLIIFTGLVVVAFLLFVPNTIYAPMSSFTLTSSAFEHGGFIPEKYSCDADNINPPLEIAGVPKEAVSLVLIMDDPDIPQQFKDARNIDSFDHWTIYGIAPETTEIPEGEVRGSEGLNGRGESGYTGPCPPPDLEPTEHRYFFKLYALDTNINFIKAPTKDEVIAATEGHVIATAELMGRYDRSEN